MPTFIGDHISASVVGPQATVTLADPAPGIHTPQGSLVTVSGNQTITVSQEITGRRFTGNVTTRADLLKLTNCHVDATRLKNDYRATSGSSFLECRYCDIIAPTGNSGTGVGEGNLLLYRCRVAGYKDLLMAQFGTIVLVECLLDSPFDTFDDFFPGGAHSAHPDCWQLNCVYGGFSDDPDHVCHDMIYQGCKILAWAWSESLGGMIGTNQTIEGAARTTTAAFICNPKAGFLGPKRLTMSQCHIDGNYDLGLIISGGNTDASSPEDFRIFDNNWVKRRPTWGGGGGSGSKLASIYNITKPVTWGRNYEYGTSTEIFPDTSETLLTPGPASSYPYLTLYDGGGGEPPPPPPPPETPGAPVYVSAGALYASATRGLFADLDKPAAAISGRLGLALLGATTFGGASSAPTLRANSGWETLELDEGVTEPQASDASNTRKVRAEVQYRHLDGTASDQPDDGANSDGSGSDFLSMGRYFVFAGAARGGNPVDAVDYVAADANGTATVDGITTTGPNRLIVALVAGSDDNSASGWAATSPATLTEPEGGDVNTTVGADGFLAIATAVKESAGATGNLSVAVGADPAVVVLLALRPPAALTTQSPVSGATAVALDATIVATFTEAMDGDSLTDATFTVTPAGGSPIDGTVTMSNGDKTATFTPDSNLDPETVYTVGLSTAVTDDGGNELGSAPVSWSFTTTDGGSPSGAPTLPNDYDVREDPENAGTVLATCTAPAETDTSHRLGRYKFGLDQTFDDRTDGTQFLAETATTPSEAIEDGLAGFGDDVAVSVAYWFRNDGGTWTEDYVVASTITADETPPGPLTSLTLVRVSDTSVRVTATVPSDGDVEEVVLRYKAGSGQSFSGPADGTELVLPIPVTAGEMIDVTATTPEGDLTVGGFALDVSGNASTVATASITASGLDGFLEAAAADLATVLTEAQAAMTAARAAGTRSALDEAANDLAQVRTAQREVARAQELRGRMSA